MSLPRNPIMQAYRNRLYPNYWDMIALVLMLGVIAVLAWNARQMAVPYELGEKISISLDPHHLPGYALRTVTRMFIALFFSLLFTFTFGTWAAKSERARLLIIPLIDICQSIPVLGFLSAAIVGFIALFPGSLLGPECAAILAIFTSQAWNMALGFYQTVRSVPAELREAADMFHLSAWQRFWRIDVPFSMPGLLWNTMLSMSAGWFFVVASEAVSVANQNIMLPGMGSYIALAIQRANMSAIGYAIITMLVVILVYDQLLFRPLVAWAEKFRAEQVSLDQEAKSWVIDLFHRTRLFRKLGVQLKYMMDGFINIRIFRSRPKNMEPTAELQRAIVTQLWNVALALLAAGLAICSLFYIEKHLPWVSVWRVFCFGCVTTLRVIFAIIISSIIWVPIGVWVGLHRNVAAIVRPVAQFLAAFPANFLYPVLVILIVTFHLNVELWVTLLMMIGVQWYILFNVIAGASVIPKDLLQATDNFAVTGWLRWRTLLLPGIFPYFVTGAITAAGGAWNASIVAEVISWGNKKLVATGLGAYIAQSTNRGDFLHMAIGIGMMCVLVLLFNRLLWRPLYVYAERRFQIT
ncbi:MAG: ABC transporter permease subunit [Gammaproteobacteria bacterium]|nr:ABC transporter permease subunit [Gammaproteobacteria bacterium]